MALGSHLFAAVLMMAVSTVALTPDGRALIAFKSSISDDPFRVLVTWNPADATPCHWHGIVCNKLVGSQEPRVVSVILGSSNLLGSISPEMGSLTQLRRLSLQSNRLYGSVPLQLLNATALRTILLQDNLLSGEIPSQFNRLPYLQNLELSHNKFFGVIPASIGLCRQLQILVLSSNFLSGSIPDVIGENLTSVKVLDLSDNDLSGPIPWNFGNLSSLQSTLNLSYNRLSGSIPDSLGRLPYTVSLDFSHNNLSGRIPQDGSLVDQGPGPFIGNPALCGLPLSRPCPTAPSLPKNETPPSVGPLSAEMQSANLTQSSNLGTGIIIAIAVGDVVGISLVGIVMVYFYWKSSFCEEKSCPEKTQSLKGSCPRGTEACYRRRGVVSGGALTSEESEGSSESTKLGPEKGKLVALEKGFVYDLNELLCASAYVLGKGGLGIVYKVVLENGLTVAVRRLGEGGAQRFRQFESEVQAIARVRHPNVVRLRAYYWAEEEKLLVYDYIPNGSLTVALHGTSQSPPRCLSLTERLRIAKGIASGLAYIHECSPCKNVHGDFKTSNVLIDMHMQAYVANFGLRRLARIAGVISTEYLHMNSTEASLSSSSLDNPAALSASARTWHERVVQSSGSPSYRPPECSLYGKPTQKCDVYAYGVTLIELITGRSPAFQLATSGEELVTWLERVLIREDKPLDQILDPTLPLKGELKSMKDLLRLALSCTSRVPDHRPQMGSVIDALDMIMLLNTV
ncbi:hypothetical protein KP509_30G009300 [Ceratopteris richardii]|uniref:Protein kinase domain-containing protein n=1 Tax=Ceratopteris richardii TaxID=49495 RepID=A0A8T2QZK6_CERRI|nr:hypothetical protein KP509_30G009300 [Ceratopteris richardii]